MRAKGLTFGHCGAAIHDYLLLDLRLCCASLRSQSLRHRSGGSAKLARQEACGTGASGCNTTERSREAAFTIWPVALDETKNADGGSEALFGTW